MNSSNYQYVWDKIWTVLTLNTGGIKYKLYELLTVVAQIMKSTNSQYW